MAKFIPAIPPNGGFFVSLQKNPHLGILGEKIRRGDKIE